MLQKYCVVPLQGEKSKRKKRGTEKTLIVYKDINKHFQSCFT